jgi:hypothetical protein
VRPSVAAARPFQPLAGLLSYLVPGLGQIVQGRVAKGVLFLVCIYALFFYGMYLGSGTVKIQTDFNGEPARWETYTVSSNVYLPDVVRAENGNDRNNPLSLPRPLANLYNRPQFAGQFWVGVAAWPAVIQYLTYDPAREQGHPLLGQFMREPREEAINAIQTTGDHRKDLGWVYTVIAGVLNILVIYDAWAGPAFLLPDNEPLREAA